MHYNFDLTDKQKSVLEEILKRDGDDFAVLVNIAGLDPSADLRGADLRDVDFGHSDLGGYDFTGADLRGGRFDRAKLEGAIFAENQDEGTVWPQPQSDHRSARATLRTTMGFELRSFQREALSNIMLALEQGVERPIVFMPPGTGRTTLLEALLSELSDRDMVGVALILAPKSAYVEQLRHRLSERFGSDSVTSSIKNPSQARLIVKGTSWGVPGRSPTLPVGPLSDETSHIFMLDDGRMDPRVLRNVHSCYPGVQIVVFSNTPVTERARRASQKLNGETVFELSYDEAVNARLLERAEIYNGGSGHNLEITEHSEMKGIVSEVLDVVSGMPSILNGGVVCRDINSVREMARGIEDGIDQRLWSHNGIQRVVQHTSPSADKSLVHAALDLPGTLLLMTNSVASDFDWEVLDYAIVLTTLRFPEHLAYFQQRRGRRQRLQIIDYMGNFDRM